MTLVFGGKRSKGSRDGKAQLPEEVRAQQCTHDKCQECRSEDNCFHSVWGKSGFGRGKKWGGHPMSALSVQPGLPFTSYRASFYADCDAGQLAKVEVRVREINNGIVQIFMNGIHKKTLTKASSSEKGATIQEI